MKYFIYDLETLINCFTFTGKFKDDDTYRTFEISSRKNQKTDLLNWLSYLKNSDCYMVGFNNLGFDYPIIHDLMNSPYVFDYNKAYQLCQQIIGSQNYGSPQHLIPFKERFIPQIDLVKINHFDNKNRRTPLKSLQVAMRLQNVEDIPVELGVNLTPEQMDQVIHYNKNDVYATEVFLNKCLHLVEMRKELLDNGVLTGDVLNYSDVKIGTEYLIKKIGRQKCYITGSTPRQTLRSSVAFKDIIFPKIFYKTEPFEEVLNWFNQQTIYTGSEIEPPRLESKLANLDFHFGVGGVHASVESKKYESSNDSVIKDLDVSGMYPSIAIANDLAPEHLGKEFSLAYKQLKSDRDNYKKGTTMNKTLKLAGNGAFGNSDNPYSCFYDPKFPKQITVNGQLQLLQLAETLSLIPGLELIQCNTDGITALVPRKLEYLFKLWKDDWQVQTGLALEEVEYSKMFIRDVNNYLAVTKDGKVKLKGAYWWPKEPEDYDGVWNKDFSMMVVQKVTELCLINNWNPEKVIMAMTDPFDFMLRYKTPSGAKVFIGDKEMTKTVRYYVSTKGQPMKKVAMPKGEIGQFKRKNKISDEEFNKVMSQIGPGVWDDRIHTKNKTRYEMVSTSIENGKLVKECNDASKFDWSDVDYNYYIEEIKKLEIK